MWANDLLHRSVYEMSENSDLNVWDAEDGSSASVRQSVFDAVVAAFRFPGAADFNTEVYTFRFPITICDSPWGVRRWFTIPWALHYMLGDSKPPNNRWVCRHGGQALPTWLEELGYADASSMVRHSKKSIMEMAKKHNEAVPPALPTSVEKEFSVCPSALLVWAGVWAAGRKLKGWGDRGALIPERALSLLRLLVDKFLGDGGYDFALGGVTVRIQTGSMDRADLHKCFPLLRRRFGGLGGNDRVHLADLLVFLVGLGLKAGVKDNAAAEAASAARLIVAFLATAFEVLFSGDGSESAGDPCFSMPVLRGASGRARRVSTARKVSVVNLAHNSPGIKDASQVAAVIQAYKRKAPDFSADSLSPGLRRNGGATAQGVHVRCSIRDFCQAFQEPCRHNGTSCFWLCAPLRGNAIATPGSHAVVLVLAGRSARSGVVVRPNASTNDCVVVDTGGVVSIRHAALASQWTWELAGWGY